ncbi:hypothetical protein R6Q59_023591 [Mikania micrantha]
MVRLDLKFVVFMFVMFSSICFHNIMAQTSHVVGDAVGWTTPVGGEAVYAKWASLQTFMVGDILIFNFTSEKHNVAEVSAAAYNSCTFTNPTTVVNSPASVTLTTTGNHFYVCTLASHCKEGQKLSINVFPPDGSTPALKIPATPETPGILPTPDFAPASSPSFNPTMPPIVTSDGTTPPPPPSGAPSFTAMVPPIFLAIGFSFL